MHRVVAIGEKDFVQTFRAGGAEAIAVTSAEEAAARLTSLALDQTVALVLTSERTARDTAATLTALRERARAVILVLPSHRGAEGDTMAEIKKSIEKALGVDLLSKI